MSGKTLNHAKPFKARHYVPHSSPSPLKRRGLCLKCLGLAHRLHAQCPACGLLPGAEPSNVRKRSTLVSSFSTDEI